jgi:hypothetical protein
MCRQEVPTWDSMFHSLHALLGAAVVLQGGMAAERAEREVMQQEAKATTAAHRQAFDAMVAAARAAPPTGDPDPMRFRAVAPGEGCGSV